MNENTIAIIAGAGALPSLLVSHLKLIKKPFVLVCLAGNASATIAKGTKHIVAKVGEVGKILAFLKNNHVKELVFAGKVQRHSGGSIKFDIRALTILGKIGLEILKSGDDKVLSHIVKLLEKQGFRVIGPEKLLPKLLMPSGILGKVKPSKQDYKDISVGKEVLAALGASDVGQAVIVENGYVLGIEAAEGTDKLISRCGKLKKEKSGVGALIKMKKLNQETRIDLPCIGIETLTKLSKAGFRGLALEAGGSLIIDIDAVIKKANELKLFLFGI